jgi:ABC-type Mn2+/Zn2+ transport system permease subunit
VSFDRAMAATLGKNVLLWDIVIYLLIGVTVSISVLSVGPLISFGFLLIPALTAHLFARNMRQFFTIASLLGGITAFLGFWLAYDWDWPVGPTEVVLLGVVYGGGLLLRKILQLSRLIQ